MRGRRVGDANRDPPPPPLSRRGFVKAALIVGSAFAFGGVAERQETTFELGGRVEAWIGESPSAIADDDNPSLELTAGTTYAITWTNLDGEPHNIAILDSDENVLRSTDIIDQEAASQTLEFEATAEMAAYSCEVHPTTMRGAIRVGGNGGRNTEAGTEPLTDSSGDEEHELADTDGQPGFGVLTALSAIAGVVASLRRACAPRRRRTVFPDAGQRVHMAIGELREVTVNGCTDLYYLDTGMYDTAAYGAVYILDAERPAIVETGIGTNREYIFDALDELDIATADVEVIAPTHVHLDHAGGAGFLAAECPNAEVAVHEIGVPHLVDPERLIEGTKRAVGDQWQFYVEPEPIPEERVRSLTEGDTIDLGDHELTAHHAPGHAPHQLVYYDRDIDALFAGDAAGIWVPELGQVRETSPPPNFDLEGCLADVEMINDLGPETLLFTHFGPHPDPDAVLAEYETVLSEWVAEVEEKRDELEDEDAVVDLFVETTPMDVVWGETKARGETAMNVRGVLHYLDGQ